MTERTEIKERLAQEGIEFLLVQFVDMTGAPKVKMVPVTALDDALDEGAGFAGASIWGLGQGPHSHDMLARIDLDSYARLSWQPNTVRFASDLFVDGESASLLLPHQPSEGARRCRATGLCLQRGHGAGALSRRAR